MNKVSNIIEDTTMIENEAESFLTEEPPYPLVMTWLDIPHLLVIKQVVNYTTKDLKHSHQLNDVIIQNNNSIFQALYSNYHAYHQIDKTKRENIKKRVGLLHKISTKAIRIQKMLSLLLENKVFQKSNYLQALTRCLDYLAWKATTKIDYLKKIDNIFWKLRSFRTTASLFVSLSNHGRVLSGIHPHYGAEALDPCHRAFSTVSITGNIFNSWKEPFVRAEMDGSNDVSLEKIPSFFLWLEDQDHLWKTEDMVYMIKHSMIPYFDHHDRATINAEHRFSIADGRLKCFGESTSLVTSDVVSAEKNRLNIKEAQKNELAFVAHEDKHNSDEYAFFFGLHIVSSFHHSSLGGGLGIACAGMFTTNNDGQIIKISNKSGHYKPNARKFLKLIRYLNAKGVLAPDCKFLTMDYERYTEEVIDTSDNPIDFAKGSIILDEHHNPVNEIYFNGDYEEVESQISKYIATFTRTEEEVQAVNAELVKVRERDNKLPDKFDFMSVDDTSRLPAAIHRAASILQKYYRYRLFNPNVRSQVHELPLAALFQTNELHQLKTEFNALVVSSSPQATTIVMESSDSEAFEPSLDNFSGLKATCVSLGSTKLNLYSPKNRRGDKSINFGNFDIILYIGDSIAVQENINTTPTTCKFMKIYQFSYPHSNGMVELLGGTGVNSCKQYKLTEGFKLPKLEKEQIPENYLWNLYTTLIGTIDADFCSKSSLIQKRLSTCNITDDPQFVHIQFLNNHPVVVYEQNYHPVICNQKNLRRYKLQSGLNRVWVPAEQELHIRYATIQKEIFEIITTLSNKKPPPTAKVAQILKVKLSSLERTLDRLNANIEPHIQNSISFIKDANEILITFANLIEDSQDRITIVRQLLELCAEHSDVISTRSVMPIIQHYENMVLQQECQTYNNDVLSLH